MARLSQLAFRSAAGSSIVSELLGAFVREREAATILGVSSWQLRKWRTRMRRGQLPFYRVARRDIRYKVIDLLRFLESSRVEPREETK